MQLAWIAVHIAWTAFAFVFAALRFAPGPLWYDPIVLSLLHGLAGLVIVIGLWLVFAYPPHALRIALLNGVLMIWTLSLADQVAPRVALTVYEQGMRETPREVVGPWIGTEIPGQSFMLRSCYWTLNIRTGEMPKRDDGLFSQHVLEVQPVARGWSVVCGAMH